MIYQGLQPFFEAFGWMLIHSLWQGLLIFIVLKVFLSISKNHSARFRYTLILTAMIAMGVWAMVTLFGNIPGKGFVVNDFNEMVPTMSDADPEMTSFLPFSLQNTSSWWVSIKSLLHSLSPWAVWLWFAGVILMGLRFTGNLFYLGQLRSRRSFPAGPNYQKVLTAILERTGIKRKINLRLSKRISEPITFGFLKPVILLPASIISQIPPDQLEALILHELAHIHRHDYLVNMLQTAMEIVFFYHPAVWWFSNKLREERELSCDDWVMNHGAEKDEYAQALIFLEKQKFTFQSKLAMSAKGNKSSLTERIYRLYESKSASPSFARGIFSFIILVVVFTGVMVYPRIVNHSNDPLQGIEKIAADETAYQNWKLMPEGNTVKVQPEFGLYIIDGQKGGEELLSKVSRTNLKSVDVLGPKAAMKVYGNEGRKGAILIDTHQNGPLVEGFTFMWSDDMPNKETWINFVFKLNRTEVVQIQVIGKNKELIQEIIHETLQPGDHMYGFNTEDYEPGTYHVILLADGLQHSFKFEKKDPAMSEYEKMMQEIHRLQEAAERAVAEAEKNSREKKAGQAILGVDNLSTALYFEEAESEGEKMKKFSLNFKFDLPEAEHVTILVMDAKKGLPYYTLIDEVLNSGSHSFDLEWNSDQHPASVYEGVIRTPKGSTKLFSLDLTGQDKNGSEASSSTPPPPPPPPAKFKRNN